MLIELDPVDRITADAVGPAGERTFFIQHVVALANITPFVVPQRWSRDIASMPAAVTGSDEPHHACGDLELLQFGAYNPGDIMIEVLVHAAPGVDVPHAATVTV